jgi:TorA maturation chaperone TorD
MRVLIEGADGISSVPLDRQRAFFETHIASWQGACVTDIRNARGAHFYARVADFVDAFLAAEANAFALSA